MDERKSKGAEEMKEQLEKILLQKDVLTSVKENEQTLFEIIPELTKMVNFPHHHPHHHLDVWNHTLLALSYSEPDLEVRLALLLHDIGKPTCYQDEEVRHFRGHPNASFHISIPILERLGYEQDVINRISTLVVYHDTKADLIENISLELLKKLLKVQYCDALAHHPDYVARRIEKLDEIRSKIENHSNRDIRISK